jgi:hypothetical protein
LGLNCNDLVEYVKSKKRSFSVDVFT